MRIAWLIALVLVALAAAAAPAGAAVTVWAVGDGADSGSDDDALAAFIGSQPLDRFLYLGDVYEDGTAREYADYYHPSFGRFKELSSPTPGNHEWGARAQGYDPYWGALAPQTNGGHWYSFDLGGWHFVSLNSMESTNAGSPQHQWLESDLAQRGGTCTIAFVHHPRYSAGTMAPGESDLEPVWSALSGHAVAVLSGHDHNYQRFHPERGLVQFVVGSGGHSHYAVNGSDSRLVYWNDTEDGALKLVLDGTLANYEFVTKEGVVRDAGSLACTPAAGPPPPPPPAPPAAPPAPSGPSVTIARPVNGRRYARLRSALGSASAPVLVNIRRGRGARCAQYTGARRGMRRGCRRNLWLRARGVARWRLPLRLPPGAYRLRAWARDASGNRVAVVRFRVTRRP